MPSIVVHHLEHSRSLRVLWLLEELGLEYEMRTYPRNPDTMRAPAELRALHPLGKAPVVTIDDRTYAESGAIIEHIVDRFGDGRLRPPAGSEAFDRYRYWMHYAEGSLMAPLLVRLVCDRVAAAPLPFFVKPIARGIVRKVEATFTAPEIATHTEFLDGMLAKSTWFAGDELTAADIQMSYPVEALLVRGRAKGATSHIGSIAPTAAIESWFARIQEREAYQRALARGGPGVPGQ